jgi:Ran GTPase-activating protein (RanGAP) involved in mRNA processing and transport
MRTLNLRNSHIGIDALRPLVSALVHNKTLLSLNLARNKLDTRGVAIELKHLLIRNKTLLSLDLGENIFGPNGVEALADGLSKNESLRILKLNNVFIGPQEARQLAVALVQNKSLQSLDLRMCNLTPEDVLVLQNAAARALSIRRKALAELLIRGAFDVRSALVELPGDFFIVRNIIEQAIPPIEILF